MDKKPYYISATTSMRDYIGHPIRSAGCILLYCIEGEALSECNFVETPLRKGCMSIIFSDTLFSLKEISPDFMVRFFELSVALTDKTTFSSAGAFFDWLYENPVFLIDDDNAANLQLWLSTLDWIEANTSGKYHNLMLRNHWQNFFLGLETLLKENLTERNIKAISSSRNIFNNFCRLLSENCRHHHEVKFYADRLCITPYYLSRITRRTFSASPKELIDRQILMEIKSLLTSTDLSVKEIADIYNFDSSSYLGRYFRRHIGMTPSEYRNSHN